MHRPVPAFLCLLLLGASAALGQPFPGTRSDVQAPNDAAATSTGAPTDVAAEAAERAQVHLVFTSGSGGIGSGSYGIDLPRRIRAALSGRRTRLARVLPFHGCLVQDRFVLVSIDLTVRSIVDFLRGGRITCANPRPTLMLADPREHLYMPDLPQGHQLLSALAGRGRSRALAHRWTCTNAKGARASLLGPAFDAHEPISWELSSFEFRLALQLRFESSSETGRSSEPFEALVVGLPREETARRFALLEELVGKHPGTLYVDGGAFVDGVSSVRDGALSLHRPLGFTMLRRLAPVALAPGATELAAGARALLADARAGNLPYVAANWATDDPDLALPAAAIRDLPQKEGSLRIAFVGVVDPVVADRVPALAREGVRLTDPVAGAQKAINALDARQERIDAVVVLTSAGPALLRRLRSDLQGADLLIGDPLAGADRVEATDAWLAGTRDPGRHVAALIPTTHIGAAELSFGRSEGAWVLERVRVEPHRASAGITPDPDVLAAISRTRAAVYPGLEKLLLPADPGDPLVGVSDRAWAEMVCEAVRLFTDADAVLLPAMPETSPIPGPQTELLTVERLAILDRLEVHQIPGGRITDLLREVPRFLPISCGAEVGKKKPKIRGRRVAPERRYRVVTTDRGRATGLGPLLRVARSPRLLDKPGWKVVEDATGAAVTLRSAVLRVLRSVRDGRRTYGVPPADRPGPAALFALTHPSAQRRDGLWLLRVRRLSLSLERFKGAEDNAFSQVPETLVTSPSSLTLGAEVDAAIVHDGPDLSGDLRVRGTFQRLSFDGGDADELADDLKFSSSLSLPVLTFPTGGDGLALMPFVEVLFDTEITPVEQKGTELPRQEDLSLTVGLGARRLGLLRRLRVGAFYLQDLARSGKAPEYGGRAEVETLLVFGPGLRFTTRLDAVLYGTTPDDDTSDLRFWALLDTRLALPLARFLDVAIFAKAYAFQGRVSETEGARVSYTLGFALDLSGAFEL